MAGEKERVDGYLDTVKRLEPEIHMTDASAFYASAAISLKRIADALELRNKIDGAKLEPQSYCIGCDREVGRTTASFCTRDVCRTRDPRDKR